MCERLKQGGLENLRLRFLQLTDSEAETPQPNPTQSVVLFCSQMSNPYKSPGFLPFHAFHTSAFPWLVFGKLRFRIFGVCHDGDSHIASQGGEAGP
jgi:hypothetical protein